MPRGPSDDPPAVEETLDGALRVVVEEIPHVRSVSLGLFVPAGSALDPPDRAGLAHFVEHMLFKGTEARSAREVAIAADSIGASLDGSTARDHASIFGHAVSDRFGDLAAILGEMASRPAFLEEEVGREHGVVAEEIRMYEDEPEERVHDILLAAAWDGDPFGRPILGTIDALEATGRDDVLAFHRGRWTAESAVLSVAGAVSPSDARAAAAAFSGLPRGRRDSTPEAPATAAPGRSHAPRDLEQVHLCLSGPAPGRRDPRRYAAAVFNAALGGSISSRLFQSVREREGLAYSIYSYLASFQRSGLLVVSAAASPARLPRLLEVVERELDDVRRNGLDDREVERGREQVRAHLLFSLESVEGRMVRNARTILHDEERLTVDELIAGVEAVRRPAVADVAAEALDPARRTTASIGPAAA